MAMNLGLKEGATMAVFFAECTVTEAWDGSYGPLG